MDEQSVSFARQPGLRSGLVSGFGDWFPTRGVQRALVALWPLEASAPHNWGAGLSVLLSIAGGIPVEFVDFAVV